MFSRPIFVEVLRFSTVGLLATLTYGLLGSAMLILQVPVYQANLVAYGGGILVSFVGHLLFTFRPKGSWASYFLRFMVVALTGFAFSNVVIALFEFFDFPSWASLAVILFIVPFGSWLASRLWAFRDEERH